MMSKFKEYIEETSRHATPEKEYKRQSSEIEKELKEISSYWKKINSNYKKQLNKDPESWKGIGAGSDLGGIITSLADVMKSMKLLSMRK